jgi:hypothetical protein
MNELWIIGATGPPDVGGHDDLSDTTTDYIHLLSLMLLTLEKEERRTSSLVDSTNYVATSKKV